MLALAISPQAYLKILLPYDYFGDNGGNLSPGVYFLAATPYSEANGKGFKGREIRVNFEIINNSPITTEPTVSLSPNPSEDRINLHIINPGTNKEGMLMIYNPQGKVVYQKEVKGNLDEEISLLKFGKGLYMVKYITDGKEEFRKIMIR